MNYNRNKTFIIFLSLFLIFFNLGYVSASDGIEIHGAEEEEITVESSSPSSIIFSTSNISSITSANGFVIINPATENVILTLNATAFCLWNGTNCPASVSGSTFNATYNGLILNITYITTFNGTYNTLLNQNCPAGQIVNGTLPNGTFICTTVVASSSTFNATYNGLIGNATYISTFNESYHSLISNLSYLTTFNLTYNNILNQMCPVGQVVNGTLPNGTFICTTVAASNSFNTTYNNILNQQCPVGFVVNGTLSNGTHVCTPDQNTVSTFNDTYAGVVMNSSYLTTFNTTYNNILNQMCPAGQVVNGTLPNGTFICRADQTSTFNNVNVSYVNSTGNFTANQTFNNVSALRFRDSSQYIYSSAASTLNIVSLVFTVTSTVISFASGANTVSISMDTTGNDSLLTWNGLTEFWDYQDDINIGDGESIFFRAGNLEGAGAKNINITSDSALNIIVGTNGSFISYANFSAPNICYSNGTNCMSTGSLPFNETYIAYTNLSSNNFTGILIAKNFSIEDSWDNGRYVSYNQGVRSVTLSTYMSTGSAVGDLAHGFVAKYNGSIRSLGGTWDATAVVVATNSSIQLRNNTGVMKVQLNNSIVSAADYLNFTTYGRHEIKFTAGEVLNCFYDEGAGTMTASSTCDFEVQYDI